MRRVSYRSVLDSVVNLAGFTVENLTTTPLSQFKNRINIRLKDAWEKAWWPELMRSELRYFRNTWSAQTYLSGTEIYHAGTGTYWTNTSTAAGTDVPGVSSKWTEITDLDAYVALEQTGLTPIGEIRGVFLDDPEVEENPRRLPYVLGASGIQVQGDSVPKSVYVWYRIRVPDFRGADYSASTAYALGVTRYYADAAGPVDYEGDFWTTVSATASGENPQTTAAKWTRLEFPAWLRECVAQGAYADWLRLDGAAELALAEDTVAQGKLFSEIIKLAGQGQILRSRSA